MYADELPKSGNCSALNSKNKEYVKCSGRVFGVPDKDNAEVHCCSGNVFHNHLRRNMKRKFHDYLTLLTSTGELLTRAGFELAPSGIPVRRPNNGESLV